ncbi:FAD-dependent oxidoreductase [Alkalicoccus chagannorensis]|uniref:FAD-dependent oxidoreductase n=1 Tax=Alkalicoccus chagannorensis TaxID=427072 RepID=UPI00040408C1|nr:FAD-dependent oxidoreductase [Alkalicoccus chagannorensis]
MHKWILSAGVLVLAASCSNEESFSTEDSYDVIVYSGEPEGVAAAVSAARAGAQVLMIEPDDTLGGLITQGMLNYLDIPENDDGVTVSQGIFSEWHERAGGRHLSTVDLDEAEEAFEELIDGEPSIELKKETDITDLRLDGNKLSDVELNEDRWVEGGRFIDASPDADLAVMAGAPYFVGQEDIFKDELMSATLMIYLDGVDWDGVREAAADDVFGGAGIHEYAAWGFPDVLFEYEETIGGDVTNMRGLNIGRTQHGEVFINALQLYGVDGLDEESMEAAVEAGIEETDHFVPWLRDNIPGFEEAEIVEYPEELYIRETRHVESEYMLPVSALWENKHHWDDIAIGGYPADIQAVGPDDFGSITVDPDQYGIPFRSLIPQEVDGLLTASKASGYSSLAAGSARVIPTGMAAAEAAGRAAAMSAEEDTDFREMKEDEGMITALQEELRETGHYLEQLDDPDYPYQGEPYYEALKLLYSYDIIFGGYDNDFYLDEPMEADRTAMKVRRALDRTGALTEELDAFLMDREEAWSGDALHAGHAEELSDNIPWDISIQDEYERLDVLLDIEEQMRPGLEERRNSE